MIILILILILVSCSPLVIVPPIDGIVSTYEYKQSEIELDYAIADKVVVYTYTPKNYDKNIAGGYPAIFILDADSHFKKAAGFYSKMLNENKVDDILIFGIGYGYRDAYSGNGRFRDYYAPETINDFTGTFQEKTNAENFYKFIIEKIVPDAKIKFNIKQEKVALLGHSLGGGFTLYAFTKFKIDSSNSYTDNPFSYFCPCDGGTSYGDFKRVDSLVKLPNTKLSATVDRKIFLYITYGYLVSPASVLDYEAMYTSLINKNFLDLTVQRFYPIVDHAATMNEYIINGLKLFANNSDGYPLYGDKTGFEFEKEAK